MEVVPGIHRIESVLGPRPFSQYLLYGERGLLVDTGVAETPGDVILPYLDSVGLHPSGLDFVLNTHADVDHFGGNNAIRDAASRAVLCAHAADTAWIEERSRILQERYGWYAGEDVDYSLEVKDWLREAMGPDVPIDLRLVGGETFRLGPDLEVEVLHLPGQRMTSMSRIPSVGYTKRFDEVGKDDVALAGGKGANLGELSRAGLPVPPGFVLTTEAYDAFVESNGIGGMIVDLASAPREEDPAAFEQVSERIHALFSGGEVSEDMAGEIRAAYQRLAPDGETAVAVRSSATAEDLAEASFAGQQETFLNVRGEAALLQAVKDCWASLWTARAMAYRARQGIAPETVSLAVVVQEMVESEAAGVMFTANPANGRRNEAAISAAWGLGESVVSGQVTPDSIVVGKGAGASSPARPPTRG